MRLPWPEQASSLASVPERPLSLPGLDGENAQTPGSLYPENILVVNLDEATGEENLGEGNFRWKDSHYAKDGHFGFYTASFSGPAILSNSTPLAFRLLRKPMLDAASTLTRVHFHVMMDSSGTPQKDVRLTMRLADRFNGFTLFRVDGQKREYVYEAPVLDVTFEHLVDHVTRFSIETPDGSALRVYEAWLEIVYRLQPPELEGKDLFQSYREGILSSLQLSLPTPSMSFHMDITDMVSQKGGWKFFSGDADGPMVYLEMSGPDESVYITDVALVLEYRSRVGAILEDRLFATVEGVHEKGILLENPADVIRCILVDKNFLGFAADDIDRESFESLKQRMQEYSLLYQRRFHPEIETGKALEAVLEGSGMRLIHEGGRFRLLPAAWNPSSLGESLETDFTITENLLLDMESVIVERSNGSYLREMTIRMPLETIHLERGDRIRMSNPKLLLDRALCEVSGFDIPSLDQIRFHLDLALSGLVCWEHDEETLIRRLSGGSAMIFFINKIAVARLEKTGDLWLLGELWEEALAEKTIDTPIQYDEAEKRILFGAQAESGYSALFALDEQGNLLTRGEIVEGKIPSGLSADDFCKAVSYGGDEYFILSLDRNIPLLAAEKSSNSIYIQGEIREKGR